MNNGVKAAVLASLALAGCGHIVVDRVKPGTTEVPNGVLYALPNTVVRVAIKVDQATMKAPEYPEFKEIFVRDADWVCDPAKCKSGDTSYSLQDGATFLTYGEPDPENVFIVRFTGGRLVDQTMTMAWNEVGLPSSVASSVTNRTIDVALSSAKLVVGLGTKLAVGSGDARSAADKKKAPCPNDSSRNDKWITELLTVHIPGAAGERIVAQYCDINPRKRELFNESADAKRLEKIARSYADEIAPMLAARLKILSGSSNVLDTPAYLLRIEQEINNALAKAFLGLKKVKTWEASLDVRAIEPGKSTPILVLDPANGICPVPTAELVATGKPIPDNWSGACGSPKTIDVAFEYYPPAKAQIFSFMRDKEEGERSFRYRVPAQVRARLRSEKGEYGAAVFSVAQLGTVISLPASQSSKTLNYELGFIEATGGLKTFKLGTTGGVDASTIDSLAGIGGTLIDHRKAQGKTPDEVAVLTRQYQLLKLRDDICALQTKAGLACDLATD